MNDNAQYSFDVNSENFAQYVIHNSAQLPVLVDFWAPWCGPCQSLMPLLTRLAGEYGGQFLLAKVNIDEEQELAQRYQVRSVPTVKVWRHGEVVDEFLGALPEGQLRRFIDGHLVRESEKLLPEILARFQGGEQEAALEELHRLQGVEPDNEALLLHELQLLMAMGRHEEAQTVLQGLPIALQENEGLKAIKSQLQLSTLSADTPSVAELEQLIAADPRNSEARYQLGLQRNAAGDYEGALEALLELLRRDRNYQDGAARKAMLMIFDTLGNGELVDRYRRLMAAALY